MELFRLLGKIVIEGVDEANDKLSKISKTAENIGSKIQSAGDKISGVGKKLMPVTTAIGGISIASGKMAISFQDSIAEINTLLDDDSHLEGYRNAIKKISNDTGLDINNMSSGMYQAISSLGDGGKETEKIFGTMATAAKAGGAEVSDSVALISAGMKGYNQVNDETAKKISDLAFQTAKLGVTTFPEMAKSMQPLFPLANSLNLSYEDLFGSMATLTGVTGNTAEVSTQLKAVFSNLMTPTTAMSDLIEKYGYASGQAMLESEGFAGMLKIVQQETGGQADKMAELFSSVEAVTAMTALTGSQFDTFNDKLRQMGDAAGATETAYGKLETTGDKLRKSWNKLKNTGLEFGEAVIGTLAPMFDSLADKIDKLSTWFSSLDESQQQNIIRIALFVAAIGPAITILGKVISTVGTVIKIGGILMSAISAINPVVLAVVAVVGALVAAGTFLYKNWDTIKEKCGQLKEAISEKWEGLKNAVSDRMQKMRQNIEEHGGGIKGYLSATGEAIKENWSKAFSKVDEITGGKLSAMKSKIESNGGGFKGYFKTIGEQIKENWSKAFNVIDKATDGSLTKIKNSFVDKLSYAKDFVHNAIEKIKGFFKFDWELPKIKLPHFKISGNFSLNPPKVPSFGIEWYKKAMDDPMIMDQPTAFGINRNGQIMAGGESGSEIVSGTETLMNMISEAVSAKNERLVECCEKMLEMMAQYMPEMANMQLVTDTGALVGAIAPQVDEQIGLIAKRKQRG